MHEAPAHPEAATPAVSVVIPTHRRPELVMRALGTVLRQTFDQIEAIVVIDGPDESTTDALSGIADSRLHVIALPHNVGGSEARNTGVRHARAKWIAFLDDDDEWLPTKLQRQLEVAETMPDRPAILSSLLIERTETTERILPTRLPDPGEAISHYLFVRQGWSSGAGFLQTSTWLVRRELLLEVPFTAGLKKCQDLDWLLHAASQPGVALVVVPEVLSVFHHDENRVRVSRTGDWRYIYDWAERNRTHMDRTAFCFVLATLCAPGAAREKAGAGPFFFLLRRCLPCGAATAKCFLLFMLCWWVPEKTRRNLRGLLCRIREVFDLGIALPRSSTAPRKAA